MFSLTNRKRMTGLLSFFTIEVFRSRKDLTTWVQNVARSLGFVIVTIRSRTSPVGYISNIVLGCEHGGVSRSKDLGKDIGTKKINCPFKLVGKYSKKNDVWKLKVVCDEHNYPPALYMEGHAQAMKLSSNENHLVQDLTWLNVKPRDILSTLKKQNEKNVSVLKIIYNVRYKFRKTEQAGRTPMQNLMYILQSKGYVFDYHVHDITNELEELFFVHPTSLTIWQTFPNVVLMDATYKTNKYNLPFLEIVGVTSTNKTFSIAFVFMNKEN
ncbi:uncharacterized protein LOC110900526 [Helianthus annuus]|uniref:uncharacterized protein LOC110900526 n=1 Tax=Helianthus annuus TaxID=4232 RepID=UPI001652D44C|nr:uncharacterized protein LOC110900526 [Helianthus annuus]